MASHSLGAFQHPCGAHVTFRVLGTWKPVRCTLEELAVWRKQVKSWALCLRTVSSVGTGEGQGTEEGVE